MHLRRSQLAVFVFTLVFVQSIRTLAQFPANFDLSSLDGTNGFVLNGANVFDGSGRSVSGAGDINGDGIDDLIIGAADAGISHGINTGESYVVFGKSTPFASSFDLSSLSGTNGFVINGIDSSDHCGFSVSGAGDVNGDGIDDLIIGAPYANSIAGESYVVFGKSTPFTSSLDLSSLNGANGFVINGIDSFDKSGRLVSGAGDVNGDGFDDLIIGADTNWNLEAGESYVVFGKGTPFTSSLNLSGLNGTNGFVLNGVDAGDRSGYSVSGAGDVNGDGIDDLIVGAYGADPNSNSSAGESYVVFGKSTPFAASIELSSLNGANGFTINGIDIGDWSGDSVSGAGDVNGDGIDDLIIGAPLADPNSNSSAGESYVVFGKKSPFAASLELSSLTGANGFVINGVQADDHSGYSVSSAGDVNGDEVDDLIIATYGIYPNSQAVESYVVFGKRTSFAASIDLSSLSGTDGFVLSGDYTGEDNGYVVSGAGDVNGDGIGDLIIGASFADPNSKIDAGESYVVFGQIPPLLADFDNDDDVDGDDLTDPVLGWDARFGFDLDGRNFLDWQQEFGAEILPVSAAIIPEPSTIVLALTASVFCYRRRTDR